MLVRNLSGSRLGWGMFVGETYQMGITAVVARHFPHKRVKSDAIGSQNECRWMINCNVTPHPAQLWALFGATAALLAPTAPRSTPSYGSVSARSRRWLLPGI